MAAARLTIDRLECRYTVPRDQPQPIALRDRLDRVAGGPMTTELAECLQRRLGAADGSVWLVRSVDVEIVADVGVLDDARLAEHWGEAAADRLAHSLREHRDGEGLVHFHDRVHQLAELLVDLADGRAFDRWYHAPFAALRPLPTDVALREALVRDGAMGRDALVLLARTGRLAEVIATLAEPGAARVTAACLQAPPRAARAAIESLVDAWPHVTPPSVDTPLDTARRALELHVMALARGAAAGLHEAAVELLRHAERLRRDGRAATDGPKHADTIDTYLSGAAGGNRDWIDAVEQTIAPSAVPVEPGEDFEPLLTDHGGLFLLLPALVELGLAADGDPEAQSLRLTLAASCLGVEPATLEADPAVRLALGLDRGPGELPAAAVPQPGAIGKRLDELGRVFGPAAWDAFELNGERAAVRRQQARDEWLDARVEPGEGRVRTDEPPPWIARSRRAAAILEHLGARTTEDLPLAVAALALMRGFSGRLLGFGVGTPDFLRENFLCGSAIVAGTGKRIEVELGRVPLQVALELAGADGSRCAVPWLGGVEVEVRLRR